jgi:5-carboxymethyl-2-hydroxymuconate isomerase
LIAQTIGVLTGSEKRRQFATLLFAVLTAMIAVAMDQRQMQQVSSEFTRPTTTPDSEVRFN